MDQLNYYGLEKYQLGKDFVIDMKETQKGDLTSFDFFFRNLSSELLGYIKLNMIDNSYHCYNLKKNSIEAIIIDTISSGAYSKNMSENMKNFFNENGYTDGVCLKSFGPTMLTSVLSFLKQEYPEINLALIASLEENLNAISTLVNKVKDTTDDLIFSIAGGSSERCELTLFLKARDS